jgi:hypothetical protein
MHLVVHTGQQNIHLMVPTRQPHMHLKRYFIAVGTAFIAVRTTTRFPSEKRLHATAEQMEERDWMGVNDDTAYH